MHPCLKRHNDYPHVAATHGAVQQRNSYAALASALVKLRLINTMRLISGSAEFRNNFAQASTSATQSADLHTTNIGRLFSD